MGSCDFSDQRRAEAGLRFSLFQGAFPRPPALPVEAHSSTLLPDYGYCSMTGHINLAIDYNIDDYRRSRSFFHNQFDCTEDSSIIALRMNNSSLWQHSWIQGFSLMTRKQSSRRTLRSAFAGDRLYADLRRHALAAAPHQPLTAERKLAEQYGISYGTVRRVVQRLVDEKRLYKKQGAGLFVAEQPREPAEGRRTVLYIDDWGQLEHPYCMRKLRGVLEAAEEADLRIQVLRVPNVFQGPEMERIVEEAARPEVGGLLVPFLVPAFYERVRQVNPAALFVTGDESPGREGVAVVHYNTFSFGYQAAAYLAGKDARSILLVHKRASFFEGARAYCAASAPAVCLHGVSWEPGQDLEPICEAILGHAPDGLVFSDDRLALSVLTRLPDRTQGPWRPHVVSSANAGEEYLPPDIVRLELDGYEAGMMCVTVLKALMAGKPLTQPVVRIEPRLVVPGAQGGADRMRVAGMGSTA